MAGSSNPRIPIYISVRHVHLTAAHVEALFGPGRTLTPRTPLRQPGQFAAEETVTLRGPKGSLARVRVVGPVRGETQVEISRTDEFVLGVNAPIRSSGQLAGTPGIVLEGPAGQLTLEQGVIQAQRHIHLSPADAAAFGVANGACVMVRVGGERGMVYDDVYVRVHPSYLLEMHLDTDEANAADLDQGEGGELITRQALLAPEPHD